MRDQLSSRSLDPYGRSPPVKRPQLETSAAKAPSRASFGGTAEEAPWPGARSNIDIGQSLFILSRGFSNMILRAVAQDCA
jgi:hypothetical protein